MLFVLTAIENKEERPVAVVDNEKTANDWVKEHKSHNWIPFELNDVTGLGQYTQFKNAPNSPAAYEDERRVIREQEVAKMKEIIVELRKNNTDLLKMLRQQGIKIQSPPVTASQLLTPAHKL